VNPYEYIFSKVPGSKFSVSKLKPKTNLFYDFLEIATTLNIFDFYKEESIRSLHITPNHSDSIDCFEMLRENFTDDISCYNYLNDDVFKNIGFNKYDFIFLEVNNETFNTYIYSLIEFLMIILRNQNYNGSCVIKISHVFHKPVIDVMFFLTSLFEKVYIIKPNTNNVTTFDKYVVCKNFYIGKDKTTFLKLNYYRLLVFLKKLDNKNIHSIFDFDIPYYFTMKLDDMNIITGQQQLESLNVVINVLRNKNKEDKIDLMKKSNIQKSVNWCEKYKIPCNKFTEKTNIFLPIIKEVNSANNINNLNNTSGSNTIKQDNINITSFESQEFTNVIQDYSNKDFEEHKYINEDEEQLDI